MKDLTNEMLQDSAIVMTSKNPSLTRQVSYTKGPRPRYSPRIFSKPGISNEFVSREIFEYYQRNRQNNDQFKGKQTLRHALENTLKQTFPEHVINLYMVGSSTNGIGDNPSAVDICIMARKRTPLASTTAVTPAANAIPETVASSTTDGDMNTHAVPTEVQTTAESNEKITLDMIEAVLQNKNFAKDIVSIPAKVPIIKFKDDIAKLDITLNLNQDVSIRNTQLIRDYAKMDWRFPYLALVLKQWARENGICSAIDKTISSYSWTLMVIHFLQVCDPPVLPSLQKMIPRRYDQRVSVEKTITNWRRYPSKWRSNNNSNLRQLLKALFRYYGYVFSFDQHVISVREGKVLDRVAVQARSPGDTQWNSFLCIEEPFSRTNTTRSVHDKEKFERIIELFRMSSNALRGVRISLFNVIADDIDFPINYRK